MSLSKLKKMKAMNLKSDKSWKIMIILSVIAWLQDNRWKQETDHITHFQKREDPCKKWRPITTRVKSSGTASVSRKEKKVEKAKKEENRNLTV